MQKDLLFCHIKINRNLAKNGENKELKELIYKIVVDENGEVNLSKIKSSLLVEVKRFHISYKNAMKKSILTQ